MTNVDTNQFLQRVAVEVARRFQTGTPLPTTAPGQVGPPFCAACSTQGQCAKVCGDATAAVRSEGAARIGGAPGIGQLDRQIADMIDHTLLKAEATQEQVAYLCAEAAKYRFASVCVNPFWVPYCAELLRGHDVKVCTVIGFPLGANQPEIKDRARKESAAPQGPAPDPPGRYACPGPPILLSMFVVCL